VASGSSTKAEHSVIELLKEGSDPGTARYQKRKVGKKGLLRG